MQKLENINFNGEPGEDLIKYLKFYIEESDKLLQSCSSRREALAILEKGISIDEPSESEEYNKIAVLMGDESKRKEAHNKLQGALDEDLKEFEMVDQLVRELFDEIAKRIKT